jgi:hypothetical protein
MAETTPLSFADVLHSEGPAADRAGKLRLYGRFVGDWRMDVTTFAENGDTRRGTGEIHFGWVLEGRAIQDVWMIPPFAERRAGATTELPEAARWYGTTLRVYDPRLDAWHIFWLDPATQFFSRQLGRAEGADIVQVGKHESGVTLRWSFREITDDSFRWLGEISPDDGKTWRTQVDIRAQRIRRSP